ncbi:hypothetical protein ACFOKF_25055 [Sphingobium rhizovicinum]|uniref:Uncharacterized protein n=1 Tax=Sphingobium rhizovicinum TaxID=432308 RepID=A0ABV7NM22_9SPHN
MLLNSVHSDGIYLRPARHIVRTENARIILQSILKSAGTADGSQNAENKRKLEHHPIQSNRMML